MKESESEIANWLLNAHIRSTARKSTAKKAWKKCLYCSQKSLLVVCFTCVFVCGAFIKREYEWAIERKRVRRKWQKKGAPRCWHMCPHTFHYNFSLLFNTTPHSTWLVIVWWQARSVRVCVYYVQLSVYDCYCGNNHIRLASMDFQCTHHRHTIAFFLFVTSVQTNSISSGVTYATSSALAQQLVQAD